MIIAPYIVLFLCNVTKCKEKKISTQMIFLDSSTTLWSTSSQLKISQFTLSHPSMVASPEPAALINSVQAPRHPTPPPSRGLHCRRCSCCRSTWNCNQKENYLIWISVTTLPQDCQAYFFFLGSMGALILGWEAQISALGRSSC